MVVGMKEHSQVKSNNKDNKTLALLPFYPLLYIIPILYAHRYRYQKQRKTIELNVI